MRAKPYLDAASMLSMLELWYEQLRNDIDDASFVRTEACGKLRSIELACLAVLFIVDRLAATTERSRLTSLEQVFKVLGRGGTTVTEDNREARSRGTEADLDIVDHRWCRLSPSATFWPSATVSC